MKILTIDEASGLFGFPAGAETSGKTAYHMLDTGMVAYTSSEDSDEWIASGRLELAEEFIFAAIRSGKLKLLGRPSSSRPRTSLVAETVELSVIETKTVQERVIDRWDGELVLVSNEDEEDGGEEFVDLHILEDDFLAVAGDLIAYRTERDGNGSPVYAPTVFGPPVSVQTSTPTAGAETECTQWFRTEIPEVPETGPGKHAMWGQARAKFGARLSYRAFSRVWDQHAPSGYRLTFESR